LSRKRVLVYVQHLLGIGHLKRAAVLARTLAQQSLEVMLVSGGFPLPGLALGRAKWVQLPPAGAIDETFKVLADADGRPIDDAWRARRREALIRAWRDFDPQLVLVELFPFGRRQMRFELLPWLETAAASVRRPVIVSSVRDVLGGGQRNPSRQDEMLQWFERYFDHVLVHGDPGLIRFERSFRHAEALGERLHYTGYVVDRKAAMGLDANSGVGEADVVVSAGGGAVGARLLEAAIRCRALTLLAERTWRILAGVNASPETWSRLNALADEKGAGRIIVERSRDDFPSLLRASALSISQGGYNTVMEILDAGARAVVVPFAAAGETEQTLRARALAERGRIECVAETDLTAVSLADSVNRAASKPRPVRETVDLDGANRSASLVVRWISEVPW